MKKINLLFFSMIFLAGNFLTLCNGSGGYDENAETEGSTMHDSANMGTGSTDSTSDMTQDIQQFVKEAYSDGMFEIQAGNMVKSKSDNSQVQEMAQMIASDHEEANAKLKNLAQQKQWELPSRLMDKHQEKYNNLQKLSGQELDSQYLSMMEKGHEEAIKKFENASTTLDDEALKTWINNTLPVLRKHLEHAQQAHGQPSK